MAQGTGQVLPMRVAFVLLAVALALMAGVVAVGSHGFAQETEGTVRMVPDLSNVLLEEGPFSVFIVLEELDHRAIVSEVPSEGLGAFEFRILYDESVVEIEEVTQGPSLEQTGRSFQCLQGRNEPGSFSFGCVSPGSKPFGPQGTFTLATVTFSPVHTGSTVLLLEHVELAGLLAEDVPVAVFGAGAVQVRSASTSTPTPPPEATATPPSPVATATLQPPGATATIQAPAVTATPAYTATPEIGSTPEATETAVPSPQATGTGTPDGGSSSEGGEGGNDSAGTILLWSLAAAASAIVAGGLGFALYRRAGRVGGDE